MQWIFLLRFVTLDAEARSEIIKQMLCSVQYFDERLEIITCPCSRTPYVAW
jgi:hypothetical protein